MLRGLASLLVLAEHTRAFVFVPYGEVSSAGPIWAVFYMLTGLGHQAVMVFFALSGFLVGGKAVQDLIGGRWSWPSYLLRRMTRLWIVLIPALLLTLILDQAGIALTAGGPGYAGLYGSAYPSLPTQAAPANYSPLTLLGNLGFLQTIAVPVFGSNGPLWSLANEFWYYLLVPLAASCLLRRQPPFAMGLALALVAAMLWLLPAALLWGALIWIAGAAAGYVSARFGRLRLFQSRLAAAAALGLAGGVGILTKIPQAGVGDLALGLVVASSLPFLANIPSFGGVYRQLAKATSEISYTLYVTHFPLLMLIAMAYLAPHRFHPGPASLGVFMAMSLAAVLMAILLWACFERQTDRVYRVLAARLMPRAAGGRLEPRAADGGAT